MRNVIQCERCLKTVLRDGVHTCTPTAGWLKLEQQLTAEREARQKAEADLLRTQNSDEHNFQRWQAAEQKLHEAPEQEPVYQVMQRWTDDTAWIDVSKTDYDQYKDKARRIVYKQHPISPANVLELQAKLDAAIDALAERDDKEARMQRENIELQAEVTRLSGKSGFCTECERLSNIDVKYLQSVAGKPVNISFGLPIPESPQQNGVNK